MIDKNKHQYWQYTKEWLIKTKVNGEKMQINDSLAKKKNIQCKITKSTLVKNKHLN